MESPGFPQKSQDTSIHSQSNFLIFVVSVPRLALLNTSQVFGLSLLPAQLIAQFKVALSQNFRWHIAEPPWHKLESKFQFQEPQFFPAFLLMQERTLCQSYVLLSMHRKCQRPHCLCYLKSETKS